MDIKQGYFTSRSKTTASVVLGFVPDHLDLIKLGSQMVTIHWDGGLATEHVSGHDPEFGFAEMGTSLLREDASSFCNWSGASDCYEVPCGAADFGISALNYDGEYAMIEHPDGTGKKPVPIYPWGSDSIFASGAIQAIPRSISNIGTIMQPEMHKNFVYELSVMNGDSKTSATEPTWSQTVGAAQDDDSCFWICREAQIARAGGKGFIMGNSVAVDTNLVFFTAYRTDTNKYIGDTMDTGEVYLNAPWNRV